MGQRRLFGEGFPGFGVRDDRVGVGAVGKEKLDESLVIREASDVQSASESTRRVDVVLPEAKECLDDRDFADDAVLTKSGDERKGWRDTRMIGASSKKHRQTAGIAGFIGGEFRIQAGRTNKSKILVKIGY